MGGICYGAKFNSNFQVIHSPAHSLIEFRDFQGSKYVQSDIGNCFKEIHDLLSKDQKKVSKFYLQEHPAKLQL